jgi:uncharacterized protein with PIN domain
MELHYRTRNGRLALKVDANSHKDLFRAVATAQEIFEAETACGCCNSDLIRFQVRCVDAFEFFELVCGNCDARFEFGQHRTGATLFPKRRDDAGNPLPHRGWKVWKSNST